MSPHPARDGLAHLHRQNLARRFPPWPGPHRFDPESARGFRRAAVLVLLAAAQGAGDDAPGPEESAPAADLFLVQRSTALRDHPGQISLPGGRIEPGEDVVTAALRETHEEIGLHPDRAEVIGELPPALVPVSSFVVHPVLAWTEASGFERAQPGEVLHALRVPVADLLDPQRRRSVQVAGLTRFTSVGFWLPVGWVWGFTGNLLDHVFTQMGWTRPWDPDERYLMPVSEARGRGAEPIPRDGSEGLTGAREQA